METTHKLVPPDGGWGHIVTASVIIMNLVSMVPQTAFGLTYGNFLASVGDETTGATITSGVFNTVQSFTGIASSFLLQRYSYRKVGLLGAVLFCAGAFGIIFMTDLPQMIISFGILEGLGYGLMMPASYSAFNCYFDKRINVMMGIAQAVMVSGAIAYSPLMAFLMQRCGFRGTVAILAVLSLLNFPAMGVLQPVKRHMVRVPVNKNDGTPPSRKSQNDEVSRAQTKPLLSANIQKGINSSTSSISNMRKNSVSKSRFSVISLGDRAVSLTVVNDLDNEENRTKISSSKCMDLSLLKDPKYLNISLGVSLSYTSDVNFIAIIPLLLNGAGFTTNEIALLMVVYFGTDFLARILVSVTSAFFTIRNRYMFLGGAVFSAVFRIVFVMCESQMWKKIILAVLGFSRCFIQTPLPLVFSEEYNENFPTAFSLYMAICGLVSIIIGLIISTVKSITQSDEMVVHVLTVAYLINSVSWITEITWNKIRTKDS